MTPTPYLTVTAAVIALLSSGVIRIGALGMGCLLGTASIVQLRPSHRSRIEELNDSQQSLEKQIAQKNEELAQIDQLLEEAVTDAASEKQQTIENLNKEVEELQGLIEEELAKLNQREVELKAEIERYRQEKEAELKAIALADEQALELKAQELSEQLNADKAEFLEEEALKEKRALDRIDFLEQELAAALWQLDKHERPQLPDGVEPDKVAARRVLEILYKFNVIADYAGSWSHINYIYVRVRPRDCGIETVGKRKHLERIRLELDLIEPPEIGPVPGAVELCLKPRYLAPLPPDNQHPTSSYQPPHPEVTPPLAVAQLNAAYLKDFVEPTVPINPYGDIQQIEIDWVNWLWHHAKPRPIRNRKAIIYRIWRAKSGDGKKFLQARERLRHCLVELGIEK